MPTTLEKIAEIEAEVRGRLERSQLYFTFLDGSYTKEQGHGQPSRHAEGETGQTASRIDTAESFLNHLLLLAVFIMSSYPSSSEFLVELKTVTEWYLLGVHLGVPTKDLDDIDTRFGSSKGAKVCLAKVYERYKDRHGSPSWEVILEALKEIDKIALADDISKKYLSQESGSTQSISDSESDGSMADACIDTLEHILRRIHGRGGVTRGGTRVPQGPSLPPRQAGSVLRGHYQPRPRCCQDQPSCEPVPA